MASLLLRRLSGLRCLNRSAARLSAYASDDGTRSHIDFSSASDTFDRKDIAVALDVITEVEEGALLEELEPVFRRKRYEDAHWDSVITQFKETERSGGWRCPIAAAAVARIRGHTAMPILPDDVGWLPIHCIDLACDGAGVILPHIDSVKFSGGVVAGLSLRSTAVMTLQHESRGDTVQLTLPPRSLYVLQGQARYEYTHAIRVVDRGRRISLIFRDAHHEVEVRA